MNEITKFNFHGNEVRTVMKGGEPWWIAKDVCTVFGDTNHNRSTGRVSEEDRGQVEITDSMGRKQKAIAVNESGLYTLLFQMQPQKANNDGVQDAYPIEVQKRIDDLRKFKKWVTSEVLPKIRKTGGYINPEVDWSDPENMRKLFEGWVEEKKKRVAAETRVTRLVHNGRTYTAGQLAKEMGFRSAQELNKALYDKGIQYKDQRGVWMLYAEYAGKGFTNLKQDEINGHVCYYQEWTGVGRDWLLGIFADVRKGVEV